MRLHQAQSYVSMSGAHNDTMHLVTNSIRCASPRVGIVGGATFGAQGGGGTASRDIGVYAFFDKEQMAQHMIGHPDLDLHVLELIRKNRWQLKT
jgi:hypothetical protein